MDEHWVGESWEIPSHIRDMLDELYSDETDFISRRIQFEDELRTVIDWNDDID